MSRYLVHSIAVLLLMAPGLPAQESGNRPRGTNSNYREGDWISYGVNRFVTSVAVGNQFVYFGTTGGITRYNFYTNSWDYPFTTSNGLADNHITAVAYDASTGFLWCSSERAISYYNPSAQKWTNVYKDEFGLPRSDEIVSIGFGDNDAFFETRFRRLYRGSKYGEFIRYQSNGVALSSTPIKWFGERATPRRRLPVFFMTNGYFFSQEGYVQDGRLRRAQISAATNDPWGFMWMGSWGFGALKGELRTQQLNVLPFGLYGRDANSLALDRNGLWIGGRTIDPDQNALTYWDQVRQRWQYFESRFINDFMSDTINRMLVVGDTLFCATPFGLNMLDIDKNAWTRITVFDGLEDENVNDLLLDGDDLWIATDRGLNKLKIHSINSDSLELSEEAAEALHFVQVFDLEKTENIVWAATTEGVYVYDDAKKTGGYLADASGPAGELVTCLDRFGDEIWFGSLKSVEAFNYKTKEWLPAPARQTFLPSPVRSILADRRAVWVGTDIGVMKFDRKTKVWRRFTTDDGLIDNRVNAILLDGDYIWFGTPSGVTVFYWNDPRRID